MKVGQSSELVIFCTTFKPGFAGRCQTVWNEGTKGFLLCAELSANYMIFIEKFLKLMTLGFSPPLNQTLYLWQAWE